MSVTHTFVSAVADGADASQVQPSNWNATHTVSIATAEIANDAVTFAKVQNASAASVLIGRGSAAGGGDFQEITLGGTITMVGTVLTGSATGIADADYGDITVSGAGAVWTIDNGAVTLAKQADMATASVVYRKTAGAGAPEVQTLATLKTDLGLTGTNSGDQTSIVGITGTKAQFDTAVTDGNILYVGDVTQYTDEMAQDAVGAMVDSSLAYVDGTPLLQRAALTGDVTASAGSNATTIANDAVSYAKMQNVSAASKLLGRGDSGSGDVQEITLGSGLSMTGTTLAAASGSGDFVGPGSSTDNAVVRFDSTTGKLGQNSVLIVTDDGIVTTTINSGNSPMYIGAVAFCMLDADYTLSNVGTEQQFFNTTANGAVTLPTGYYRFRWMAHVSSMSATSGNAAFDPLGAGTAVIDNWMWDAVGIDNNNPMATAGTPTGVGMNTQQTPASAMSAQTGTGMRSMMAGMFRISTGGTMIPSITLVTAAAAVAEEGSYIWIERIGDAATAYYGAWT